MKAPARAPERSNDRRWTWLDRVGEIATRRARIVVIVWLLAVSTLAFAGKNLSHEVKAEPLYIAGTPSARAHELALKKFGNENTMILTLSGPPRQVEDQGRALVRRLDAVPGSVIVSPWSPGATIAGLRPTAHTAAIIARLARAGEDSTVALRRVRHAINRTVSDQVHTNVAGVPSVIESYTKAGNDAAALGELIAAPILLLVLLLVFRSVVAAALPLIVGGAVVVATRGVLSLLVGTVHIEAFSVSLVGMIGLALGVDYSLLVVSRFREERRAMDPATAVRLTVRSTGRSIVPAGCGLLLAAVAARAILPGSVIASGSVAVVVATLLSMISAICVTPALLAVLGDNVDRWALPARRSARWTVLPVLRRVSASSLAIAAIMLVLLISSILAFTLKSNVATADLLPASDSGRQQQEAVGRVLGDGWRSPIEVVVDGKGSPITSPSRLRALAVFERRVRSDPNVETMAGFSHLHQNLRQLEEFEHRLVGKTQGLNRLSGGISRVRGGAAQTQNGFLSAAQGADKLSSGIEATRAGAGAFAKGLNASSKGSTQLANGLSHGDEGASQLAQGTKNASQGIDRLSHGLEHASQQTGELSGSSRLVKNAMRTGNDRLSELQAPVASTEQQLTTALSALQRMTAGRTDAEYTAVQQAVEEAIKQLSGTDPQTGEQLDPAYAGVASGLSRAEGQFDLGLYLAARIDKSGNQAQRGVKKLEKGAEQLDKGLGRVSEGSRKLSRLIKELAGGSNELPPALRRLGIGAENLVEGLDRLGGGANGLEGGLSGGAQQAQLLTEGLGRIGSRLETQTGSGGKAQLRELRGQSPGLFHSGYFYLAGLDGTRPERRKQVNFLVNLNHGGLAARMMVIPRTDVTHSEIDEVRARVQDDADLLARQTGTNVIVGGPAINQLDINETYRGRSLLIRLVLSLITMLVLIPVLRSLTIPFLTALLNVVAVSATFGLMSLLFDGSALGGPGYIDTTVIPIAMMILFGLATDYEVFVFARIREEYVRTGSTDRAISDGLTHIAPVVTGAALIMIAVFVAFSISSFMTIRNLGVALTIGIFIDAFIIRLVLVPALMRALGDKCWWMPRWIDRLLPGGNRTAPGVAAENA